MTSDLDLIFQFFLVIQFWIQCLLVLKCLLHQTFHKHNLHKRCIWMCLELSYFATSYSACRFLLTESIMLASNCSHNICGKYCPCVAVESRLSVAIINLAICSRFSDAKNSGRRLIISLNKGLSSIASTIREGHSHLYEILTCYRMAMQSYWIHVYLLIHLLHEYLDIMLFMFVLIDRFNI